MQAEGSHFLGLEGSRSRARVGPWPLCACLFYRLLFASLDAALHFLVRGGCHLRVGSGATSAGRGVSWVKTCRRLVDESAHQGNCCAWIVSPQELQSSSAPSKITEPASDQPIESEEAKQSRSEILVGFARLGVKLWAHGVAAYPGRHKLVQRGFEFKHGGATGNGGCSARGHGDPLSGVAQASACDAPATVHTIMCRSGVLTAPALRQTEEVLVCQTSRSARKVGASKVVASIGGCFGESFAHLGFGRGALCVAGDVYKGRCFCFPVLARIRRRWRLPGRCAAEADLSEMSVEQKFAFANACGAEFPCQVFSSGVIALCSPQAHAGRVARISCCARGIAPKTFRKLVPGTEDTLFLWHSGAVRAVLAMQLVARNWSWNLQRAVAV